MKKGIAAFLYMLLITYPIFAQDKPNLNRSVIKFHPFGLLDLQPTLSAAFEQPISPNKSIQIDIGYIFDDLRAPQKSDYKKFQTSLLNLNIRTEYRYYYSEKNIERKNKKTFIRRKYLAVQGFYKRTSYTSKDDVCPCEWAVANNGYESYYTCPPGALQKSFAYTRHVLGGHIKIGWQRYTKNGFVIDTYLGLGARKIITTTDLKNGYLHDDKYYDDYNPFLFYPINVAHYVNYVAPSLTFGVKFGFSL